MTVLGSSPEGRPYLGRISQTVGGAGAGSGSDRDLVVEKRKNRENRNKIRWELKLLAAMVIDERGVGEEE